MIGFADGAAHGVLWLVGMGAIMLLVIFAGMRSERNWQRDRRDRKRRALRRLTAASMDYPLAVSSADVRGYYERELA